MDIKEKDFSYILYKIILDKFLNNFKTFNQVLENDDNDFVILRHDVEFDLERALTMARIENEHSVNSIYFIQVCSNAYNPFSPINLARIKEIKSLGHQIGLHFYSSHLLDYDWNKIEVELIKQNNLLEDLLGCDVSVFSFHRPKEILLENRNNIIAGLINAYGEKFFDYSDNPTNVKYISDSLHLWRFGHPLEEYPQNKTQLLFHPDYWSLDGLNELDNFKRLIDENATEFKETLNSETKNFSRFKKMV